MIGAAAANRSKYRFTILAWFPAHIKGNEDHVTVTMLSGPDWDHLSICGSLTMTERQWMTLAEAIKAAIPDDVEFDDQRRRREA
jgi:hypothetical protein